MRKTVLILFVLIGSLMVINAPVSAQGPDCSGQFGDCKTSVGLNCAQQCQVECDVGTPSACASCKQNCAVGPLGSCVLSREGCVGSGGTDSSCDSLYMTCNQASDSVAGACFD